MTLGDCVLSENPITLENCCNPTKQVWSSYVHIAGEQSIIMVVNLGQADHRWGQTPRIVGRKMKSRSSQWVISWTSPTINVTCTCLVHMYHKLMIKLIMCTRFVPLSPTQPLSEPVWLISTPRHAKSILCLIYTPYTWMEKVGKV